MHLDVPLSLLPDDFVLARAYLPDEPPTTIEAADHRAAGDAWLRQGLTAVSRVPSVLVPGAWNLLLNPRHSRAAEAEITELTPFRFDPRL